MIELYSRPSGIASTSKFRYGRVKLTVQTRMTSISISVSAVLQANSRSQADRQAGACQPDHSRQPAVGKASRGRPALDANRRRLSGLEFWSIGVPRVSAPEVDGERYAASEQEQAEQ